MKGTKSVHYMYVAIGSTLHVEWFISVAPQIDVMIWHQCTLVLLFACLTTLHKQVC